MVSQSVTVRTGERNKFQNSIERLKAIQKFNAQVLVYRNQRYKKYHISFMKFAKMIDGRWKS